MITNAIVIQSRNISNNMDERAPGNSYAKAQQLHRRCLYSHKSVITKVKDKKLNTNLQF